MTIQYSLLRERLAQLPRMVGRMIGSLTDLDGLGHESELVAEVGAVDAGLEALHVPAHVGLRLEQVALVELGGGVVVLVGADDVALERLDHQQSLAQGPCPRHRPRAHEPTPSPARPKGGQVRVAHRSPCGGPPRPSWG
jgi:hypothetical protein